MAKSEEDIGDSSLDGRAKRFLADRFRLLLAGYSQLADKKDDILEEHEESVIQLSVWRLKKSEKDILQHYFNMVSKENE